MSNKKDARFFMEIFNNILKINEQEIAIIYDKSNNIWFGLTDIIKSLEYNNYSKARKKLKINKNNIKIYSQISSGPLEGPCTSKRPYKKFINESGLYELLSISTKPLAKIFMNKYFTDIMPKIRENGKYELDKKSKKELDIVNKKLKSIKKSNKDLLLNMKNIDYPKGNHIYIIKQKAHNTTYYKIGYTKNLNKRIKVYNTGNANKIFFNYIIKVEDEEINKCIKKIMKNQEYIKNKEFYKVSLNSALRFINKCSNDINNISCGYCIKEYSFITISKHKCKLHN
jgi:prophage antirepressor-like protein